MGAAVGLFVISLVVRTCMKLIHKNTGYVVAEQSGSALVINDPFIQKELKLKGIQIPPALRSQYDGKSIIRMDDPLFAKAFKEVYLKMHSNQTSFEWTEKNT